MLEEIALLCWCRKAEAKLFLARKAKEMELCLVIATRALSKHAIYHGINTEGCKEQLALRVFALYTGKTHV